MFIKVIKIDNKESSVLNFLKNHKKIVIALVSVLCLFMISFSLNRAKPTFFESGIGYILAPIQSFNTSITDWISSKFNALTNINEIENENEKLREEVYALQTEVNRLKLIEDENKKLSEMLKIDQKYSDYPKVGARIIAKDTSNWYDVFLIDKGANDGIKKNMVVIASGGLVGKISETGLNYSKVISIIDDTDSVGAKSLRTDDIGFVRGDFENKGMCKMEYVDTDAEIMNGDEIVTSHLSDIYPPGTTIGYVKDIQTDENTLTKCALISPTVDFKHLENVLIITQSFKKNLN